MLCVCVLLVCCLFVDNVLIWPWFVCIVFVACLLLVCCVLLACCLFAARLLVVFECCLCVVYVMSAGWLVVDCLLIAC